MNVRDPSKTPDMNLVDAGWTPDEPPVTRSASRSEVAGLVRFGVPRRRLATSVQTSLIAVDRRRRIRADSMSRAVGPGSASLEGLRWLASVGPAPLDAWGTAMGWATSTAFSHAARLIGAGLMASCSMRRGHGSLFYATDRGVRDCGVDAAAPRSSRPRVPGRTGLPARGQRHG